MDAVQFNQKLDAELLATGIVTREFYFSLSDAYGYGAASTVEWVEAKLRVLAKRLSAGQPVVLFHPNEPEPIQCRSVDALSSWAISLFPGVEVRSA